ncbi:PREDICTED: zinc finger protein 512B-like, partial [Priapulus caudatus]|uniref:Zinc finger protein 512B-like n=1 Tax=Priapulus caudatus TaxID=37621 RepID=A0ABM1EVY5_PRICU
MRAHALKEESAQKLREEAVKEENGEETPTPMRKRRHAAEKARQIVKKMASDIAESGSKSRDSKKETVLPYKVPDFLPVTPEMLSTWKQELKKNGFIHCEFPNCPSRFDDWQAYRRHYIRCPCSPHDPGSYACLSCSKEYSTPEGIKWHNQT